MPNKSFIPPLSCFFLALILANFSFMAAQEKTEPDADTKKYSYYTVGGTRHGVSFFPKVDYPETMPRKKGELDFSHYHTYQEVNEFLKLWAEKFSGILDLYSVGKSFEGRDIYQVTVTNKKTGKASDKPAVFIEGGRHAGEVTASESVLWLLQHLLHRYGQDGEITHLIDTKAFYLRVQNNPDGCELYLHTAQSLRSTVRPHDSDGDGLLDEDPAEDLDGDGAIRQMRRKVGPGKGNAILHPGDPSGRLMKTVPEDEGDWMVYSEGIDNDLDGKYNEDGIGGLDLHRNYPENWRPDKGGDDTERGWVQPGAGEYPLSETETRSVVLFLLSHPNVGIVNSMDTSVPMHLRPPSTSPEAERMYAEDMAWYRRFDEEGKRITGYPWAGDVYETYQTRVKINPVTGEPNRPEPLFGHGPDFGYWSFGAIWYGDEIWNSGAMKDYNQDGLYDSLDSLRWNDEALGGRGFRAWTPYVHPVLGEVEIGGFHPKFFQQNPPPQFLEEWIRKQALFNLMLARHLPQIEILSAEVTPLPGERLYQVSVTFTNNGELPTALEQAKLVKMVRQDMVRLEFDKELVKNKADKKVEIVEPAIRNKDLEMGWTRKGEVKTVRFQVRLNGIDGAKCTIHLLSTRGGHLTREVIIGPQKQ